MNSGEVMRQRKGELGTPRAGKFGKVTRKCIVNKGYLARFVMQITVMDLSDYLFLVLKRVICLQMKYLSPLPREIYALLLGRKGEGREFLLCLMFLNCSQLKILMPKWHILW